mgnify:CR=1 FL=1
MKISAIRVEVTPWTLSYTGSFELRIKVETFDGKEAVLSHIVERNDLECFFDRTWKCLGEDIKTYWKKEDEKV